MPKHIVNPHFNAGANNAAREMIAQGARCYVRAAVIPALLRRGASDFGAAEPLATIQILAALRNAQRRERALSGRWTYDLNRHIALVQAIRAEENFLAKTKWPNHHATKA